MDKLNELKQRIQTLLDDEKKMYALLLNEAPEQLSGDLVYGEDVIEFGTNMVLSEGYQLALEDVIRDIEDYFSAQ